MFFRVKVFQVKLDNISFLFNTNYQTIKFLRLYLQNSKWNEKYIYMKHRKQPLKGFLQKSLTWRQTNYQTIKFLRLYLQNSKRNEK